MSSFKFPFNKQLIWDYELPPDADENEPFKRWYLGRVLTRGNAHDLKEVGFTTIYAYLPVLHLPSAIRQFWEWYFSLPHVQRRYGHINRVSEEVVTTNWSK